MNVRSGSTNTYGTLGINNYHRTQELARQSKLDQLQSFGLSLEQASARLRAQELAAGK